MLSGPRARDVSPRRCGRDGSRPGDGISRRGRARKRGARAVSLWPRRLEGRGDGISQCCQARKSGSFRCGRDGSSPGDGVSQCGWARKSGTYNRGRGGSRPGDRNGDYADPHRSEESPRIRARQRGRRARHQPAPHWDSPLSTSPTRMERDGSSRRAGAPYGDRHTRGRQRRQRRPQEDAKPSLMHLAARSSDANDARTPASHSHLLPGTSHA